MKTLYALLVGIDEYQGGAPRLNGCVNDIRAVQQLLEARAAGGDFKLALRVLLSGQRPQYTSPALESLPAEPGQPLPADQPPAGAEGLPTRAAIRHSIVEPSGEEPSGSLPTRAAISQSSVEAFEEEPSGSLPTRSAIRQSSVEAVEEEPSGSLPTRSTIIAGFQEHLALAGPGDTALFYFSGHGSQEQAAEPFWVLEPDHLNETLVCYDSRAEGGFDLADKELAVLIGEVARAGAHVLVVLDACHSGSGTRAEAGEGLRLAPLDKRHRPIESYLPGVLDPGAGARWHVALSACRANETAREKPQPGGQVHGVLTHLLLDTLRLGGPGLTYRSAFNRLSSLAHNLANDQHPVLEAAHPADLELPVLGGALQPQAAHLEIAFEQNAGWVLKAGVLHGLPAGAGDLRLALYPFDHLLAAGADLGEPLGQARVTQVGAARSLVSLELRDGSQPAPETAYKAVLTSAPPPAIRVCLEGDEAGAVKSLARRLSRTRSVRRARRGQAAELSARWEQAAGVYHLAHSGSRAPTYAGSAEQAAARLEHMARWLHLLRLDNPHSLLPAGAVALELYQYFPPTGGAPAVSQPLDRPGLVRLAYDPQRGERSAMLQVCMRHTALFPRPLFCLLLDLTEDYAVHSPEALFGNGVWLQPGQAQWAALSASQPYIHAFVPKALRQQGRQEIHETLKLIACTQEVDAYPLRQGPVDEVSAPHERPPLELRNARPRASILPGSGDANLPPVDWRVWQVEIVVSSGR